MQRSNEVRNMRYDAIKDSEDIWQMESHDTKNRTMHRVPLNRLAHKILAEVEPYTLPAPMFLRQQGHCSPLLKQKPISFP